MKKMTAEQAAKISNDISEGIDCGEDRQTLRAAIHWWAWRASMERSNMLAIGGKAICLCVENSNTLAAMDAQLRQDLDYQAIRFEMPLQRRARRQKRKEKKGKQ